MIPGVSLHDARRREVGRRRTCIGELRGELAEHEVLAARADQSERRSVPEDRRAAVAADDLPSIGQVEERGQPG